MSAAVMMMEMIMPPPAPLPALQSSPVATQIPDEFRDKICSSSESMSHDSSGNETQLEIQERCQNLIKDHGETENCDKGVQNAIQKLLAESTAAIAELGTNNSNNQEDELVSTPSKTAGSMNGSEEDVQQRPAPR